MKFLRLENRNLVLGVGCYKALDPKVISKEEIISWIQSTHPRMQVVRGEIILSYFQAFHALYQAYLAFERKTNISRSFALEVLLRISATRQIDDALDFAGLPNNAKHLCLLIIDNSKEKIESIEKEFIERFKLKEASPKPNLELIKDIYGCTEEPCIVSKISLVNLESNVRRK